MNTNYQESTFQHVLESLPLGLILLDTEGKISFCNVQAAQLLSMEVHQLVGQAAGSCWPPLATAIQAGLEQGQHSYGQEMRGTLAPLTIDLIPLEQGLLCLFKHQKQTRELSSGIHKEVEIILDSSFDGFWICDSQGTVLHLNKAAEKINDIKAKQIIGQKVEHLVFADLIDRSITMEVIKTGKPQTFAQHLKNGKKVLSTGNPVFDEQGKLSLIVVNERDITELNKLRYELEESYKQIEGYRSEIDSLQVRQKVFSKSLIRSEIMSRLFNLAIKAAHLDSTVVLQGETGVGSREFAQLIHHASPRKEKPFVYLDCTAIPESSLELELFGDERGEGFAHHSQPKIGFFELANGGTLMIDEIEALPLYIQTKIQHFLQNQRVTRVGGQVSHQVDIRIVVGTHENLESLVREKKFRKDLFLRLNIVPILLPPLRDRVEDIPPLIEHYLNKFNACSKTNKTIHPKAMDLLCCYRFPGNMLELANLIEQLVVLVAEDCITEEHLPAKIRIDASWLGGIKEQGWKLPEAVEKLEREMIQEALEKHPNQRQASKVLGIDQSTLSRKLKKYKIQLKA